MDIRNCAVCTTEFDLDTSGLEGPNEVVVCGTECAKKSASSRGSECVVHDDAGAVTDHTIDPADSSPRIHHY